MPDAFEPELAFTYYRNPLARWSIELADGRRVYLSAEPTQDGESLVVWVDAQRFLALWRNDPHNGVLARGGPAVWKNDQKFQYATDGFAMGPTNPVPLADVVYQRRIRRGFESLRRHLPTLLASRLPCPQFHFVGFSNGITRTLWLLAHGARAFPVNCDRSDGAANLHARAGWPSRPPETAATFIGRLQKAQQREQIS